MEKKTIVAKGLKVLGGSLGNSFAMSTNFETHPPFAAVSTGVWEGRGLSSVVKPTPVN